VTRDWRLAALGSGCTTLGTACLLLVACSSNPSKPIPPQEPLSPPARTSPVAATPTPTPTPTVPAQPIASASPWDRLRQRFAMPGCDYSPSVLHWARLYTQAPGQFSESLSAVMPFLLVVLDQIEQRGLPGEFAFLPYIESTYTPLASSGDRAAGIWQLMPDTAREAGLHITADYDGRLDIRASTNAALDLLQRYDQEFGDWRLANMAFNAGEYRVKQLVGDNKVQRSATELGRLRVRPGTHTHLAKLLAVACVVSDPQRFHVELPDPNDDDSLVLLEFPAPVDLILAARLAGIDEARLRHWNPGLLRARMPVNGPFHLLLPASRRLAVEQTLGKLPQYTWRDWHNVALKQTETLELFASENDLDVSALATINGVAADAPLAPGTHLLLPGRTDGAVTQELPTRTPREASSGILTVRAGDNLWSIAHQHGVSIDDLLRWNSLSRTSTLHLGQHLRIDAGEHALGGAATAATAPATP
jgi:membrane-bound lytic murein transglycosylase D